MKTMTSQQLDKNYDDFNGAIKQLFWYFSQDLSSDDDCMDVYNVEMVLDTIKILANCYRDVYHEVNIQKECYVGNPPKGKSVDVDEFIKDKGVSVEELRG
jgi:hypothetical protein